WHNFLTGWPGDLRLDFDFRHRRQSRQAIVVARPDRVGECLKITVERSWRDDNAPQPFHRCHAVPTGDEGAHGESVRRWQVLAVHSMGTEHLWLFGLRQREAAGIVDLSRRFGLWSIELAFVVAFENYLHRSLLHTGTIQQHAERHTGPLRIAHAALLP